MEEFHEASGRANGFGRRAAAMCNEHRRNGISLVSLCVFKGEEARNAMSGPEPRLTVQHEPPE